MLGLETLVALAETHVVCDATNRQITLSLWRWRQVYKKSCPWRSWSMLIMKMRFRCVCSQLRREKNTTKCIGRTYCSNGFINDIPLYTDRSRENAVEIRLEVSRKLLSEWVTNKDEVKKTGKDGTWTNLTTFECKLNYKELIELSFQAAK